MWSGEFRLEPASGGNYAHNRMRKLASVAVIAGMLAVAPGAAAEQIVVGPSPLESFTISSGAGNCVGGPCLAFQDPTEGGADATSPVNGVVTSWSVRTGSLQSGSTYRLRIIRVAAGSASDFTVLRSSGFGPPIPAPGTYTQTTGLPISAGDRIALGATAGSVFPSFVGSGPSDRVRITNAGTDPPDGSSGSGPMIGTPDILGANATVEFCRVPDVVGKKIRNATALVAGADCAPRPKRKKKRAKPKKRKRVVRQSPAPGLTAAPGTEVTLVFRR